jgi:hypothetical protein
MTQSAALAPQTATRTLHASLFHKPFILLTLQPCCFNRFSSNFFAIIPLAQESSAPSPLPVEISQHSLKTKELQRKEGPKKQPFSQSKLPLFTQKQTLFGKILPFLTKCGKLLPEALSTGHRSSDP